MTITTLALALTVSVNSVAPAVNSAAASAPSPRIAAAVTAPAPAPRWTIDRAEKRPGALPLLYASFGALQFADAFSTKKAIAAGAHEVNPLMKPAARNSGAMFAMKAASTAASIYFAEKMWKKNRKGAVVVMALINGVTAAVVANNMKNSRNSR